MTVRAVGLESPAWNGRPAMIGLSNAVEELRCHRRCPHVVVVTGVAPRGRLDRYESLVPPAPGTRSAKTTATTPGSCSRRRARAANVSVRRSWSRRRRLLLERPVQIDASGQILSTGELFADADLPHRLACALHRGRDAHGGQRDLRDHRARPHATESQRGAAGAQVGEMRLHTRARDPQRREALTASPR